MNNNLEILADAISDVGVWTWWQSDSADYIQFEFSGTQLWNPPLAEGQPPSGKIAIGFSNVSCVSFLTFDGSEVEENWPQLLQQDEIDYFNLDNEAFTFTDTATIRELIKEAATVQTLYGTKPNQVDWAVAPVKLAFRAWSVGVVIAAEEMSLLIFQGEFGLNEVEEKSQKWWEYWNEYWRVKDTADALPEDYACEVTIPAGGPIPEDED